MERFGYFRASSVPEALALLNEPGKRSRPLAGGTDLVLLMHQPSPNFDHVIDISLIPELHRINRSNNQVVIGAAATFSEIIESEIIQQTAPLLVQACQQVGAVQIRNMGTLGGNVANAAACADSLPALVCLDAVVSLVTPAEERQIPVSELVLGPNRTLIPPGGLLTHLSYEIPPPGSRSIFIKLGRRNAMAISRLTIAALGRLDESGRIAEARLVPGSATPQIRRFSVVEQTLIGQFPAAELFRQASSLAIEEMARMAGRRWSSEFKEPALSALTCRALTQVFMSQPGSNGRSA
jgi:CO/xanthine dehydrogenase FAD-binding subunit